MTPKIEFATLETCGQASDTVVVIDVLRAFTTAACAFGRGAQEILLTSEVKEALALKDRFPGSQVMGEVNALAIPEFDYSNSSAEIDELDLADRRLIQRTSAGTQGIVRSAGAGMLLGASFVCAAATARYVKALNPKQVTFVITGIYEDREGDEDWACAEYLGEVVQGKTPDPKPFLQRVYDSTCGRWFTDPKKPEFPENDIRIATQIDRFASAMPVERIDGLFVMRPVPA
ncbi:MAG: 2-phosphosulfolactate phosphatase [Alphaproteobacteria bacterium]|nr:2-phosphosulfolactate phosphatase [Alphaproteobacteria bacterium]